MNPTANITPEVLCCLLFAVPEAAGQGVTTLSATDRKVTKRNRR
jgi:hypothetical protein